MARSGRWNGFRGLVLLGALAAGGCDDDVFDDRDRHDADDVLRVACDSVIVDHEVSIVDRAFVPAQLTIRDDEVVRWTNLDDEVHTVTAGDPRDPQRWLFDWELEPGESLCLLFDDDGFYDYFCEFHPRDMDDGLIRVR